MWLIYFNYDSDMNSKNKVVCNVTKPRESNGPENNGCDGTCLWTETFLAMPALAMIGVGNVNFFPVIISLETASGLTLSAAYTCTRKNWSTYYRSNSNENDFMKWKYFEEKLSIVAF